MLLSTPPLQAVHAAHQRRRNPRCLQTTHLAYHTALPFVHNLTTGEPLRETLKFGRVQYLLQLNQAGRHVARMMGIELVDWARMLEGLPFFAYLGSNAIHPYGAAGPDLWNVFLNILHRHTMHTSAR